MLILMCLLGAALVLSVPVADAFGSLGLAHLYVIALLGGAGAVVSTSPGLAGAAARRRRSTASANSRLNVGLAVGGTATRSRRLADRAGACRTRSSSTPCPTCGAR
ncbi:hypothetical protein [Streptomyces sp. KL116D]|uniref:hypothetical protein n=1 Tax=Streptomyces sp. KL116D TaxID=3045152 RepID=UPI003556FCA9